MTVPAGAEPRVAIVLRTRNRPKFLRRALADIAAQTYRDVQVVVVNDAGDVEEVEKVVADSAMDWARPVQIVHNERSYGREAAMNSGVTASQSLYLSIHDDDDTWHPTFLERTVAHLDASADLAVATRTEVVYEVLVGDEYLVDRRELLATDKTAVTAAEVLRRNFTPPISLLYRRSAHEQVGLYDASLPVLADWDFVLRLVAAGEIGFITGDGGAPLAFWHHREHVTGDAGNSVVTDAADHRRYDAIIRDRYLRRDLADGGLGTALLAAGLADRLDTAGNERTLHLSVGIDRLENRIAELTTSLSQGKGIVEAEMVRELIEMNQLLISHGNRMISRMEALSAQVAQLEQLVFSQTPRARLRSYQRIASRYLDRGHGR